MKNSFVANTGDDYYEENEISEKLIIDCLDKVSKNALDFLVLTPDIPIQGSLFLQVLAGSVIEIRMENPDGTFIHYSYTTEDKNEVIKMFISYWQEGKIPDIKNWENITSWFQGNIFSRVFSRFFKGIF